MRMVKALLLGSVMMVALFITFLVVVHKMRPDLTEFSAYFSGEKLAPVNADKSPEESVKAIYFGTSTILITDGVTSIMTDGFFSRPSAAQLLIGKLEPDRAIIRKALVAAGITKVAAVIPIHSHHDHAMDSPEIAQQTGAMLLGSASSVQIGRGWGVPESQLQIAENSQPYTFGKFKVTLIPGQHTPVPAVMQWLTGIGEAIERPMQFPARLADFKEGGSFSVLIEHPLGNVLVHGSGGFVERALDKVSADVVFLGVAGASRLPPSYLEEYYQQTVTAVGATRVIPVHWDDFTLPVADNKLTPMPQLVDDFASSLGFVLTMAGKTNARVTLMQYQDEMRLYPPGG